MNDTNVIDLSRTGEYMSQEDYLSRHMEMRKEIMTDEEIGECDHFIEYYKESWYDKDTRNLFTEWQLADTYWEGDVNLPEYDDDPGSNTNIVDPNVEGRIALFMDAPCEPIISPIEIGDVAYQEDAQIMCEFILEKNKINRKREMIYRRFIKYGISAVSVIWDFDCLDKKGMPSFRAWNPADIFTDPVIKDPEDFQDSRYLIFQAIKSKLWAKNTFGEDKASAIRANYHPIETEWIFGEDEGLSGSALDMAYMHLFVFTKDDKGKVRLVQQSACGVKLWDSKDYKEVDYLDKYPLFLAINKQREGTIYGKSSIKDLLPLQDTINDFDDQIRVNARLTGNIQKIVGSNSGIDPERWTNEPGLVLTATDPKDWQMVQPAGMPQYIIQRRDTAFNNEAPMVTRFSPSMTGVRQQGVDTATEALGLLQTGNSSIDKDKTVIQDMLAEATAYAFELSENYWDTEMAFRITGNNKFARFNPSKLNKIPALVPATDEFRAKHRESAITRNGDGRLPTDYVPPLYMQQEVGGKPVYRKAMFDIKINMGAGIPMSKAFKYNALKESMNLKAIDIKEYRKGIRELGVLPVADESEAAIVARLQQQAEAQAIKDKAAADANMTNAVANAAKAGVEPSTSVSGMNQGGSINRPGSQQGGVMNASPQI